MFWLECILDRMCQMDCIGLPFRADHHAIGQVASNEVLRLVRQNVRREPCRAARRRFGQGAQSLANCWAAQTPAPHRSYKQ